ncbi:VOC family protein [Pseudoxanthomonas indica]|uniref:Glyoxalase superfamily enzyme, possibly 3-demethylubiquinone-9 3-methyltransferase n=1 Tax=Pseudoxanthomonas indica TaxID=428993 RepID=A0A1T5LWZ8_9GAMM|nr:VOC family protein [Pseudoxanthomonas indica]GGD41251.1 VOC family protein [Pseudoxanthomonas indica]SKC80395.1 Glyoxalase superfamily enzyme, possibly 3-demethylubiquinone-9 3-methyltransferase [Pseudoxanthomonas indica]
MSLAQPIIPHLWYDKEAREAAEFYCSILPDSRITSTGDYKESDSDEGLIVSFELAGQPFMAINAGTYFKLNPAISFMLNFDPVRDKHAREKLDATWDALAQGGKVMMERGEYPFSPYYGFVQDRYGLCWQLMLGNPSGQPRPFIMPSLMFTGEVAGKAEQAAQFYRSVFDDSREGYTAPHPKGSSPDKPGTALYTDFVIDGDWFSATDSAYEHGFGFNEAVSFLINCRDQAEIDRYWKALSHVPASEQCGWVKDQFGVSWQISPLMVDDVMKSGDRARIDRLMESALKMKKIDIATLEEAVQEA